MSTPFDHGAGHIHPMNAVDPGLVYDLSAQDYVDFLCGLNYTQTMLSSFTKGKYNCSSSIVSPSNLNYPSLTFLYNQHYQPPRRENTFLSFYMPCAIHYTM